MQYVITRRHPQDDETECFYLSTHPDTNSWEPFHNHRVRMFDDKQEAMIIAAQIGRRYAANGIPQILRVELA